MKRAVFAGVVILCGMQGLLAQTRVNGVLLPQEERFSAPARVPKYGELEQQLLEKIRSRAEGLRLDEALEDRTLVTAVLAWDTLHTAGTEHLDRLAAGHPKYAQFLGAFLSDAEWMTLYAGAGQVPKNTAVGIRVLADIWARDRRAADFRKFLNLATGVAAAWGAGPTASRLQFGETLDPGVGRCDPVWRYFFFKRSELDGLLHKGFSALRPWEIRFVAGNAWGDSSLAWTQKNINLHPECYGSACWAAPYCGHSEFGDTVQGPLFYVGFPHEMSEAERTVRHGGVCGALSTTGATAASAHGIPAYTCGQPGHCAYAFRLTRGAWSGGFGGPDGGPHNWIFPGPAPAMVRVMEAAFADDAQVDEFVRLRAAARVFAACSLPALSNQAWRRILKAMPLQVEAQWEFQKAAMAGGILSGDKKWSAYARHLLAAYRDHGFALLHVLAPIQKELLAEKRPEERIEWFMQIQEALCRVPPSWSNSMKESLSGALSLIEGGEEDEERFMTELLKLHQRAGNEQTFGQAIEWVAETTIAKGQSARFARVLVALATSGELRNVDEKKKQALQSIYGKAVVAAEKARSLTAFAALAELVSHLNLDEGYDPKKTLTLPAGQRLVSEHGLLIPSSTSSWDRPCAHAKVLRDADGAFHTDSEAAPYVMVELPKSEPVATVMIVKNSGNEGRSKRLRVSRSLDGQTWFPLAENSDTPAVWSIPLLPPESIRWVKVEQLNDEKSVMHLRNILLFAREAGEASVQDQEAEDDDQE